jgi:hypothetical protein
LDFADKFLFNKEIEGDFYMTPYSYTSPIEYSIPF